MAELLPALAISGAMLLVVVAFTIFVSIAAVKRGEAAMLGGVHDIHHGHAVPAAAAAAGPTAGAKAVAEAPEEVSVAAILILGLVLFGLAMGGLMAVSVLGHLM